MREKQSYLGIGLGRGWDSVEKHIALKMELPLWSY